jgi:hypothetical protein
MLEPPFKDAMNVVLPHVVCAKKLAKPHLERSLKIGTGKAGWSERRSATS